NQGMQREMFSLVESVVVLNETGRRMLVANGSPAAKLVLNRLGVSHAIVGTAAAARRPIVTPIRFGYVGRLHPTKGLAELMRAVRAIPADVAFTLDVRGPMVDAATRRFVDELTSIVGSDPRVVIRPGVPAADVPELLEGVDVLVCPSMWFE